MYACIPSFYHSFVMFSFLVFNNFLLYHCEDCAKPSEDIPSLEENIGDKEVVGWARNKASSML